MLRLSFFALFVLYLPASSSHSIVDRYVPMSYSYWILVVFLIPAECAFKFTFRRCKCRNRYRAIVTDENPTLVLESRAPDNKCQDNSVKAVAYLGIKVKLGMPLECTHREA
jgi:hypothetical protein